MQQVMSRTATLTPVTVVTGFLGSGKTTLIARLLRDPCLSDTAVIINEFGEVGLDHALVETLESEVVLLPQGCVCCMVNGSLFGTLEALDMRRIAGEVPAFRRVVVETTGLADPVPVLHTLLDRAMLLRGYVPGRVITTVDAVNSGIALDRYPEALRQVAVADRLLLTKGDLADSTREILARLADLNPRAPILTVIEGQVAPEELLGEFTDEPPRPALSRFMVDSAHARRFTTVAIRPNGPVPFKRLADWLGELVAAHGEHLLRVKGIVAVEGQTRPVAVHGVQHVFHPPRLLDHWPAQATEPVIVFVLDGIDPSAIHQSAANAGLISKGVEGYGPRSG